MKIVIYIYLTINLFLCSCNNDSEAITNNKPNNYSLLVAEYKKDNTNGNFIYLVSYNLVEGKLTSTDTILSASSDDIHYGFGGSENQILENRYVVTALGNIIDLKSRKLIKKEKNPFISYNDEFLVFDTDNNIVKEGYTEYNLHAGESNFVKDSFFTPNRHLHSLNDNYKIILEPFSKSIGLQERNKNPKIIVENAGSGTPMTIYSSQRPTIPVIWLDSENIIYAFFNYYSENYTQIRKVNVTDKTENLITSLDSIPAAMSNARFYKDFDDNIIFSCAKGDFKLNIQDSSLEEYTYKVLSDDFSLAINYDSLGLEIRHENNKIGKLWCKGYSAKITKGHIALEYGEVGSNLGYPKGVKIWSEISNEWITLDIPWVCSIVGWYQN